MKFRLLFISAIILFCATFSDNEAKSLFSDGQYDINNQSITEYVPDYTIDCHEQKLLLPRQTNFASQQQVRTISKRQTSQRNSYRHTIYISGRPIDTNYIKTYQSAADLFPTGLRETFRHFISLGKLII